MKYTEIRSIGTKIFGVQPDDIQTLLRVLARHPLNRTFERTFIQDLGNGATRFHGNFLTVSHVFDIRSNDPEIVDRLTKAIDANRRTLAFRAQPSAARQMRAIRKLRSRP
jgi:hypothetical protein